MKAIYIDYYRKKIGLTVFIRILDNKKVMAHQSYPRYMEYRYGITKDLEELHSSLTQTNLLRVPEGTERLRTLKVTELKDILKQNALPVSGRKEDLIERIERNIDEDKLIAILPSDKVYYLSDEGRKFLEQNEIFIDWHKRGDMCDFNQLLEVYLTTNFDNFSDIHWAVLQQNKIKYRRERHFGLLRNTFLEMGRLLIEEFRYREALIEMLKVLFIDLSGYGNNNLVSPLSSIMIYPGISKIITPLAEYFEPCMFQEVYREKLPSKYFDKATFEEVAIKVVNGEDINLDKYR